MTRQAMPEKVGRGYDLSLSRLFEVVIVGDAHLQNVKVRVA